MTIYERFRLYDDLEPSTQICVFTIFAKGVEASIQFRFRSVNLDEAAKKYIALFRATETSVPRDKVLAALNLLAHSRLEVFEISYSLPMEQVYRGFTDWTILSMNPPDLSILGHCIRYENVSRRS